MNFALPIPYKPVVAKRKSRFTGEFKIFNQKWLGREDSNLRMQEPKSCVLPLDDAPLFQGKLVKYI